MDETSIQVKGQRYDLYRVVDKTGQTIDFLLTELRDERGAKRFLTKAIRRHGVPEKITIDGSEANHQHLGSLTAEDSEATYTVDTCLTCKGYVNRRAVLQPTHPYAIVLEDLATVDWDLVA